MSTTTNTTESKFAEAQNAILNLQSEFEQKCAFARHLLMQAEEEIRQLKADAAATHLVNYTEEEAADALRVSLSTLRRLRKDYGRGFPHWRAGDLVRFTNFHLVEITELLSGRADAASEARTKKKSHLRRVATGR